MAEEKRMKKEIMPVLFVSHGSPMNIVTQSAYTDALKEIVKTFKKPKAIVVISAHWYAEKSYVSVSHQQETIYDFYGFPEALYQIKYEPKGSPTKAKKVQELLKEKAFLVERGLDHGAWSVLTHMYPEQDVPTFQLAIDKNLRYENYFEIGEMLQALREEGVLVIGSGGVTHNLGTLRGISSTGTHDKWAVEFDRFIADAFSQKKFAELKEAQLHDHFDMAHPFDDHFIPLLYVAGLVQEHDSVEHFYEEMLMGNLSMRCIKIG
jgi:4,5-DOPA dioxygenase extradiol